MRLVTYNQAVTLAVDLPVRADATPTFVVKAPSGGTTLASTAVTMDGVNTTLSAAPAASATSVTVTSATGITAGRKYLVGGSEDSGGERVTVKSVSGTTVTLVRPLRYAKASGAAFQSTRVSLALTAAAVPSIGRHYRAEITWAVSTVTQDPYTISFDAVRFVPRSSVVAFDDVADVDPLAGKRLPAGAWFPALRDEAWDAILDRVAQRCDPGAVVSAEALSRAHVYLCRALLAETAGPDWQPYRELMAKRFAEELDAALTANPVDGDQDGAVEAHEQVHRTIELRRG